MISAFGPTAPARFFLLLTFYLNICILYLEALRSFSPRTGEEAPSTRPLHRRLPLS
jgi:hypothetical protein